MSFSWMFLSKGNIIFTAATLENDIHNIQHMYLERISKGYFMKKTSVRNYCYESLLPKQSSLETLLIKNITLENFGIPLGSCIVVLQKDRKIALSGSPETTSSH